MAPGESDREGISVLQSAGMFPDDASAASWFESQIWPGGEGCPKRRNNRRIKLYEAKICHVSLGNEVAIGWEVITTGKNGLALAILKSNQGVHK